MIPEPAFSWQYRCLINSYRLAPERSDRLLAAILSAAGARDPKRERRERTGQKAGGDEQ